MYIALILLLALLVAWQLKRGVTQRRPRALAGAVLTAALSIGFFAYLELWGELLWYDSLGYAPRFWRMLGLRLGAGTVGAGLAVLAVYLLTLPIPRERRAARVWPEALAGFAGGVWGLAAWDELARWLYRVPTGRAEPVLGLDAGFYLFVLPLLDQLYGLLFLALAIALVAAAASLVVSRPDGSLALLTDPFPGGAALRPLRVVLCALAVLLGAGVLLNAFHLLYSDWGVVAGAGWTDIHVRLPAYLIVGVATAVLGAVPLFGALRARIGGRLRRWLSPPRVEWGVLGAVAGSIAALWFVALSVVPRAIQWLIVEPNELRFEAPYIAHNIDFTRQGFRLHAVEERRFPAAEDLSRELLDRSEHLLAEARLWDWRALDAVYKQFQEIRLYYEFADVDMDRYAVGERYRQLMVSARELAQSNLPAQSQTFVNQRFVYTHGFGLTMTSVSDFTPDGLPDLLVRDLPPQSRAPELAVAEPRIYYGELTGDPVYVNSREPEFDYPSGDENAYIHYPGRGGVPLLNLWRKFVYGWKFDGTRFFLSAYPTPDTRVMFHRQIRDRVETLAPFLEFDADPYVALVEGRLYWIIDAYTTSRYYPYSEPFSSEEVIEPGNSRRGQRLSDPMVRRLDGANYVRNAVKVVVDAFEGTTRLYVFEPEDPLIRVWQRAFPGLFQPRDALPDALRAHVRYPVGFLLAQGLVYAKYHMGDPSVFYNQEDLWVRATEKYYAEIQPVEPYYVMWQRPGESRAEFVLILPFTPKNRQVMIGWIAGMCDGDNYGRFLAYKFPKERRVLGPQQVETKIDQDRFLSAQLTLWDQRGSQVIRGNVLAIPLEDTLLYVEPIYLRAETAAYPELRLVAVMHGDDLSYAETFEEALAGLLDGALPARPAPDDATLADLARRAGQAFERYLALQAEQRFDEAAVAIGELRDLLRQISGDNGGRGPGAS